MKISVILRWYSVGFKSYDYNSIRNGHGKEFDRFIDKCTVEYVLDLHVKSDFALHNDLYDYDELDEDGAD